MTKIFNEYEMNNNDFIMDLGSIEARIARVDISSSSK